MDFWTAVKTCFSKYTTFSGRARRSEYWFFILFLFIVGLVASIADSAGGVGLIVSVATFLPNLAAGARRLHDTDRSGWWLLLALFPLLGLLVLIIFLVQRGSAGANRFGDDPLAVAAP